MRRLFADRLALATGIVVVVVSLAFAFWRSAGA